MENLVKHIGIYMIPPPPSNVHMLATSPSKDQDDFSQVNVIIKTVRSFDVNQLNETPFRPCYVRYGILTGTHTWYGIRTEDCTYTKHIRKLRCFIDAVNTKRYKIFYTQRPLMLLQNITAIMNLSSTALNILQYSTCFCV